MKTLDDRIREAVQSLDHAVPSHVEQQLLEKLNHQVQKNRAGKKIVRLWAPAAALVCLVAGLLLLSPLIQRQAPVLIKEIRTEFELRDKHIKIIWFQKNDFDLRRKNP